MNNSFEDEAIEDFEKSASPKIKLHSPNLSPPKNSNNNQSYHIIEPVFKETPRHISPKFEEKMENEDDVN